MRLSAVLLSAGLLAGCATPAGEATRSIVYETGPCFGACPVFRLTINSDGTGLFEGMRFTAVSGERHLALTPQQFAAFERHLAPLRPASGDLIFGEGNCENVATDMPSADVTWIEGERRQHLHFYYGCDMERNRAMAERLTSAPGALPVAELIRAPE